jgi:hypothetical protein
MTYDEIIDAFKGTIDRAATATRGKPKAFRTIQVDAGGAIVVATGGHGMDLGEIQDSQEPTGFISIPIPESGIPRSLVKGILDAYWTNTDRPRGFDVTCGVLTAQTP